jgi:hypothetical protein
MECAHCVVILLICLNKLLIFVIGSFSFASKLFIDGICVVDFMPATKTMNGLRCTLML